MTDSKPQLLIVGQATIDDIYREDGSTRFLGTPGGDALYAALGASMWPLQIGVVSIVGADYPKEKLERASCNPSMTDWTGIRHYSGSSIHDTATYFDDGRRTYEFEDVSLLEKLSPGPEDLPVSMRDCKYVHVAPSSVERQLELATYFTSRKAVVSLDVETHFFDGRESVLMSILRLNPIFIPSIEHVQKLSGVSSRDPSDLWPWISGCGASTVIVKCGPDGAWVADIGKRTVWQVGVVPEIRIVDETGAGDAFCGGFMAGLALTGSKVDAAAYGTVSASYVVESLGAARPEHFDPSAARRRLKRVLRTVRKRTLEGGKRGES